MSIEWDSLILPGNKLKTLVQWLRTLVDLERTRGTNNNNIVDVQNEWVSE